MDNVDEQSLGIGLGNSTGLDSVDEFAGEFGIGNLSLSSLLVHVHFHKGTAVLGSKVVPVSAGIHDGRQGGAENKGD